MMKRVLALGFFDGVHLGHAALIRRTKERAEALGAVPASTCIRIRWSGGSG